MIDKRGSIWRKWDLHIHPPDTKINNQYLTETDETRRWDNFVHKLDASDVEVFGITDYFSISGYKKLNDIKKTTNTLKNKTILPNVELRLDISTNKAGENINIHLLFDQNLESEIEKFLSILKTINIKNNGTKYTCSASDLSTIGYENVCVTIDELKKALKDTFGENNKQYLIISMANGNGGIRANNSSNRKKHLADNVDMMSDLFFGRKQDVEYFQQTNRYENQAIISTPKLVISGSDSHSFDDLDFKLGKHFTGRGGDERDITWIKADPFFNGLKQAIVESKERAYIGDVPDKVKHQNDNQKLYMSSVHITTNNDSNEWFDKVGTIDLNFGLVAIIGNKGSGKSALADFIGLSGNSYNTEYSFLNKARFLGLPAHLKYTIKAHFLDNYEGNECSFSKPQPDRTKDERVIYLSQKFLQNICDDEKNDSARLRDTIYDVIFSHLPEDDKLDCSSINELIKLKSESIDKKISKELKALEEVNSKIILLEDKDTEIYKLRIQNQLEEVQRQLTALVKPTTVNKPVQEIDPANTKKLIRYRSKVIELTEKGEKQQQRLNKGKLIKSELEAIVDEVNDFEQNAKDLIDKIDNNAYLKKNNIAGKKIINLKLNLKEITDLIKTVDNKIKHINYIMDKVNKIVVKRKDVIKELELKVDKKESEYQQYLIGLQIWETKKSELTGSADIFGSLEYFKTEKAYLEQKLSSEINTLYTERETVAKKIFSFKAEKRQIYSIIYTKAQEIGNSYADIFVIPRDEFIEFKADLKIVDEFEKDFLGYIHQNRIGTFQGVEEGRERLDDMIIQSRFDTDNNAVMFPQMLIDALRFNLATDPNREHQKNSTNLDNQLKDQKQKKEFYNYLFSFDYIEPDFIITYANKKLKQLSPGERGILLLVFYLLISKDARPIIIDQPEENLDNETIFLRLVKFIKYAKQRRQIIIVTHNPNLAVVSDAEQIIYCFFDRKNKNSIKYFSGGLENNQILKHVLNILEGTKTAFDNSVNSAA